MAVIHAVAFLRQSDAGFEKTLEPLLSAPQPESRRAAPPADCD
jgi:hypothetical protein